jgi:DNA-binding CsgD family transcriptional regulator
MSSRDRDRTNWKRSYELLMDVARQESFAAGLLRAMDLLEELVPADHGVSLMRMEGLIPYCVRWPDYSDPLIPRFNDYLNRRSPMYFDPPYEALPPVDWDQYRDSEYHNEFNRPLGIRYSLGIGVLHRTTASQYALFVHRGRSGPAFSQSDCARMASLRQPLSRLLPGPPGEASWLRHRVHPRETQSGCGVLSPRESQIAELLCLRLTMREIADRLGISPRTVERHAFHIYAKLNVSGKRGLMRVLLTQGVQQADAHVIE